MASAALPGYLLPRIGPVSRSLGSSPRTAHTAWRSPRRACLKQVSYASSSASTNEGGDTAQRVLEKPSRFNPPSHPSRRAARGPARAYPGPPLPEAARRAQATRQYPNMMPPEGSFGHWFLTNRSIHIWITLGTLFSLAGFTFVDNFRRTSPFAHLLPAARDLVWHPWSSVRACVEVLRLHTAYVSAQTAERRKTRLDDVQKRRDFRDAHGLPADQGLPALRGAPVPSPSLSSPSSNHEKEDEARALGRERAAASPSQLLHTTASPVANEPESASSADAAVYTDWEGKRRPVKKWLGIW